MAHYKELVHGAWNEAMDIKSDVKHINDTVVTNQRKIEQESSERENTDNLLMELFQSVLDILSHDVSTLQNVEKKAEKIEKAEVHLIETKFKKEMESTKKLLDSHQTQLAKQKAQLLDFDKVESKLSDIEFRLRKEFEIRLRFMSF